MRVFCLALQTLVALVSTTHASILTPPVLPLFVRNPYLSLWLQDARSVPWSRWPMFWTGQHVGMSVMASLPDSGTVFPLLGRPQDSLDLDKPDSGYNVSFPIYKGAQFDASTTNLTYLLPIPGAAPNEEPEIVLSFLSPITPTSTMRQAIPAAYLTVHVSGKTDVAIYLDFNGQWVSGDNQAKIEWDTWGFLSPDGGDFQYWTWRRQEELAFSEINDHAEWGKMYVLAQTDDVDFDCGVSAEVRKAFARDSQCRNEVEWNFRGILDEEPVFAFSHMFRLADTKKGSESILFTLAHIQDEVSQFSSARGLTYMRPLWKSYFSSENELLFLHYRDFAHTAQLAANFSEQLTKDARESASDNYADIVSLSARQVMGATSFSGTPESPLLFLKEISSNGNTQTVDVIFPSWPFFLYASPRWAAYLLEPLLEHQLSGQYPNKYSMHDLGAHFPNFTGHADGNDEYMPVEECGDMLIMGLSLVNSLKYGSSDSSQSLWAALGSEQSGGLTEDNVFALEVEERDGIDYLDKRWGGGARGLEQAQKWLSKSYRIWDQWTSYLVEFSLEPHNQLCTDDFAGWLPLQTNLALKGIVGIKAMSQLAEVVGNTRDAKNFKNISDTYIDKWQDYGISRDGSHAKLSYDWFGSWTTLYSLYADALLCFHPSKTWESSATSNDFMLDTDQELLDIPGGETSNDDFIPPYVYELQSKWYDSVLQKYGLPLDSRHLYTKSDWEFEAAAVALPEVRKKILDAVALWVNETITDRPLTDLYISKNLGGWPGPHFMARPVVGAHFSFLALDRACS